MRNGLFLLAAIQLFGQTAPLSPNLEFNLNAGLNLRPFGRNLRSSFAAGPNGLTLITIGYNHVSLASADFEGRILHSRSDLVSVNAQIYAALPRQDGSFWLASSGPYNALGDSTGPMAAGPFARIDYYNNLDLYSASGDHLGYVRLLSPVAGSEKPIAVDGDQLVLRSAGLMSPHSQLIRFGTVVDGQFKERTLVHLAPPVSGVVEVLASNGDLLLIDKKSGNMLMIDPRTKGSSIARPDKPHSVRAAAVDSNSLYLLSADTLLETDLTGGVISSHRLQFSRGFQPVSLGVTGKHIYLVDAAGRAERFQLH